MERIGADDRGRALRQPEHDVPAAAPAREPGPDRGQLGAPRAPHAALLLAHRRRAAPSTSGWSRRCGPSSTRSRARSTRSCARCTALEDARGAEAAVVLRPRPPCACGPTEPLAHLRRGLRPRARAGSRTGRRRGGGLVWESTPAGRGQVTEKVVERAPRSRSPTLVFEERLAGRQVLPDAAESADGARVELSLEYALTKYGPLGVPADCSSSAARCATRCAAPCTASRWRRRRRRGSARFTPPCSSSKPPSWAPAPWAGRSPR